jgi:hypothetical protein
LIVSDVSVEGFVAALLIGSALLAMWILVRLPKFGPVELPKALLHVFASVVVGAGIAPGIRAVGAAGVPGAQFIGTFAIALPALTYMFLAAAWLMRLMRDFFQNPHY